MSIDLTTERLVTLAEAGRRLPKKISPTTLWRWHAKGINGVRLETLVVGATRLTSLEALQRFADRLTAAGVVQDATSKTGVNEPSRTSQQEHRLRAARLL